MSGFVTFVVEGRTLAGRLDEVREVVRATGIEPLAGARAPVTGLLVLRGQPVPVVDLRSGSVDDDATGDVLVLQVTDGVLGLAVDEVVAVLGEDELVPAEGHAAWVCRRTSSRSVVTPPGRRCSSCRSPPWPAWSAPDRRSGDRVVAAPGGIGTGRTALGILNHGFTAADLTADWRLDGDCRLRLRLSGGPGPSSSCTGLP